jgi:hypothetical protein
MTKAAPDLLRRRLCSVIDTVLLPECQELGMSAMEGWMTLNSFASCLLRLSQLYHPMPFIASRLFSFWASNTGPQPSVTLQDDGQVDAAAACHRGHEHLRKL